MVEKIKKSLILAICGSMLLPGMRGEALEGRYIDKYSHSAYVVDYATNRVIYEKNSDKKRAMASVSKVMTLLLTFEAIEKKKVSKNDNVTIIQSDVNRVGTNILLNAGDKFTLEELMNGMMIVSANDAALAIARYVGGSYDNFVDMMNKKAKELGMNDTIFYNPNGLPMSGKISGKIVSYENTTTARDVVKLERYIYQKYPKMTTEITDREKYSNSTKNIDEPNTNPLLPLIEHVDGLKTGYTDKAGYNLAYSMKVNSGNGNDIENRILGVSLGAPSEESRKITTYNLLKFVEKNYKTKKAIEKGKIVAKSYVKGKSFIKLNLYVDKDVYMVERNGESYSYSYDFLPITSSTNLDEPVCKLLIKNQSGMLVRAVDLRIKSGFWRFIASIAKNFTDINLVLEK